MNNTPGSPVSAKAIVKEIEYDWYKDSTARYLGYANEIGEAFRNNIPGTAVAASYGIAMLYVIGDTIDKFRKNNGSQKYIKAGDTLIWQTFASVAIPGFTINRICWLTKQVTKKLPKGKIITTIVGLCSIPIIIHPIDQFVHFGMNNTYRRMFHTADK